MTPRKAMLSVLQLFAGFSFFAVAIFFFCLPFLPKVRLQISDALLTTPQVCYSVGAALMTASFMLIGGFYFLSRGRSLTVSMGQRAASIDTAVIQKTLEECFNAHFSGLIILSDLYVVRGSKLEIEVCFTPFEENLREELFASVQKHLTPLLNERFGYSKPFGLIVKSS